MKILKSISIIFCSLSFYLFFAFSPVHAGFGVSPGEIYNDHLKPGTHFEQEIFISRSDPDEDLTVLIEPELGPIEKWFQFLPDKKIHFPKGQNRLSLKVLVNIPTDASFEKYSGVIRIKAYNDADNVSGIAVIKGARIEVNMVTTELEVNQLNIKTYNIPDVTTDQSGNQHLVLKTLIENNGNTDISPSQITIDVFDLLQKPVASLKNENTLPPIPANQTKEIEANYSSQLSPGEYFANLKFYLKDKIIREDKIVFKVSQYLPKVQPTAKPLTSPSSGTAKTIAISLTALSLLILTYKIIVRTLAKFIVMFSIVCLAALALSNSLTFKRTSITSPAPTITPVETGQVKGESTAENSATIRSRSQPLTVSNSTSGRYYLYKQPDLSSPRIYSASENERFEVLEENANWYRVLVGETDIDGWLPKSSVKSAN